MRRRSGRLPSIWTPARPELIRGLLRHAHCVVAPLSLGICLVAVAVAWVTVDSAFLVTVLLILPVVLF